MEWYEVIIGIVVFIVGTYIGIKVNEINKNKYHIMKLLNCLNQ